MRRLMSLRSTICFCAMTLMLGRGCAVQGTSIVDDEPAGAVGGEGGEGGSFDSATGGAGRGGYGPSSAGGATASGAGGAVPSSGGNSALGGETAAGGRIGSGGATAAGGRIGSGGATVAEGGATAAEGGATVAEGGATVAEGGATVAEGGATVAEGGALAVHCGDGEVSGDESDVDCGGSCAPELSCAVGQRCREASDCSTLFCSVESCATPTVKARFGGCTESCDAADGGIKAYVMLVNSGAASLDLTGLEIRYYFTDETGAANLVNCYYLTISTVTTAVEPYGPATATADSTIVYTFSEGTLQAGGTAFVNCEIHAESWAALDETNDYSYNDSDEALDTETITIWQNGALLWGVEP